MKKVTAVILTLALLAASVPAFATNENDQPIVSDMLFARPLGIASIPIGAALWVISMPFALLSGSLPKTTESLLVNPIKYTINRPVGDYDYEPASRPAEEQ